MCSFHFKFGFTSAYEEHSRGSLLLSCPLWEEDSGSFALRAVMESARAILQRHFSRAANRIPQMQVLKFRLSVHQCFCYIAYQKWFFVCFCFFVSFLYFVGDFRAHDKVGFSPKSCMSTAYFALAF